jgi:hypothetical protein
MSILAPPYLNSPIENNHIDAPTICRRLEIRDVSPILIRRSAYNQAYMSDSKYKSISNLDLDLDLDFDLDLELGVSPPRPLKTPSNLSHSRIKTKRWFNIYNYVYNYIYK